MQSTINLITHIGHFFVPTHLPIDEQRKRGFLALVLVTLIPVLSTFGGIRLWHDGLTTDVLVVGLAILLGISSLGALHYSQSVLSLFRFGVLITISILTFQVIMGHGNGVAFLWFYFLPVAAFFLAGLREGLIWVLVVWVINLLLLVFNLGYYHYESAISIRFMVTYTLVGMLSYGLESSRYHYYTQLQKEKVALEAALQQIKTLQGLLPICASCKKIRDDAGYWHQVETYLGRYAAVEFSHSICPDCRLELYPLQMQQEREQQEAAKTQ